MITVEYSFSNHTVETTGFRCIFCRDRDFHSLHRLRFHFDQVHANHKEMFQVEPKEMPQDENLEELRVKVIVESESRGRGSRRRRPRSSEDEFCWNTPSIPFDINKSLQGDKSWEKKSQIQKPKVNIDSKPKFKVPEEVALQLPHWERKRHTLPAYPIDKINIQKPSSRRWFDSNSKAIPGEGGLLSDSDDDITEPQFDLRRNHSIYALPVNSSRKGFLADINSHIADEQPNNVFLGPCLMRWVTKRRAWMKNQWVKRDFDAFARHARERGYISEEVYLWCLKSAKEASQDKDIPTEEESLADSSPSEIFTKTKGKQTVTRAPASRPILSEKARGKQRVIDESQDILGHNQRRNDPSLREARHGGCQCGKPVEDALGAISCSNEV